MIHVCVPVLRRYDLLSALIASLHASTLPAEVVVIDNGLRLRPAEYTRSKVTVTVHVPDAPMGVAESWNWFIDNVPEERVIANDDVAFGPRSLELLTAPRADAVFAKGVGFSCFVLRDRCVRRIGVFDEAISPGYAYYEDEDYMARMRRGGIAAVDVDADVSHLRSQTLETFTEEEMHEHHRKFHVARANFVAKWGMMPGDLRAKELA